MEKTVTEMVADCLWMIKCRLSKEGMSPLRGLFELCLYSMDFIQRMNKMIYDHKIYVEQIYFKNKNKICSPASWWDVKVGSGICHSN